MRFNGKKLFSSMASSAAIFAALTFSSAYSVRADSGDPPERVARLGSISGTVSLQPAGVNDWSAASSNYPIATGDRVYTDQDGRAELQIGQTIARMWHNTDLTVTNLSDNIIQLGLAQGTIRLRTYGLDPNMQIEIDTPNGALTVTQPGDLRVDSYTGDGGTVVTVNAGAIQLSGPSLSENIGAGQSVQLLGTNPIQIASLELPAADEFDVWSIDRDRHILHSNSARYVSRDAPGYDDLDDYGDWTPQTDYGPVWYPRSVPAGWVPYRYGHWVWTGPWGWTWVEDEPWGYAPFHYGRWVSINNRWGWIPGPVQARPIWSPALVVFVGGPHFVIAGGGPGVSAWFPLGPGEPYAPWYHCSPRYVNQVNITNIHVTRIINVQNNYKVTNMTNINYVHREMATTAVSAQAFSTARPVASNMVRVDPRQLAQAQVIPHPDIKPTMQSVVVRPVSVRAPAARPTLLTQGGHEAAAVPGARSTAVPYRPLPPNAMQHAENMHPVRAANPPANQGAMTAPRPAPARQPVETNQPAQPTFGNQHVQQPNGLHPTQEPPQQPVQRAPVQAPPRPVYGQPMQPQQQLVNRNETPAPRPTFQQQQPALNQHPGRPLEPQQMENLHQGKPAGPQRDQELIPHAGAQPQQHGAPPSREAGKAPAEEKHSQNEHHQ